MFQDFAQTIFQLVAIYKPMGYGDYSDTRPLANDFLVSCSCHREQWVIIMEKKRVSKNVIVTCDEYIKYNNCYH